MNQLDLPISLYAATGKDKYRKPRTGMWDFMLEDHNLHQPGLVSLEACYFIGDAGGRTGSKTGIMKPDFSCSDRYVLVMGGGKDTTLTYNSISDMASNVGIKFQTPEEFFLGEEPRPFARTFDPISYLATVVPAQTETSTLTRSLEVISTGILMPRRSYRFDQEQHTRLSRALRKSRLRKVNVFLGSFEAAWL